MYTYSFEKLEVWQESKDFCVLIYKITSSFPDDEIISVVPTVIPYSTTNVFCVAIFVCPSLRMYYYTDIYKK